MVDDTSGADGEAPGLTGAAAGPRPSSLASRGRAAHAVYRDPGIPDYRGNPFIEALPPIMTEEEAGAALARFPSYEEEHRQAPDQLRFHLIQCGMRFFAPLPVHLDLERRFSCLIRGGYVGRNPAAAGFWRGVREAANAIDADWQAPNGLWSTAAGFNIVGISGVGKSTAIASVLDLYDQVIHHGHYRGRNLTLAQMVWLKLDCPYDGSPRGLCINFFQAVDNVLGTRYRRDFAGGRRTVDEMLPDMANVAAAHGLGVLVVDEIQRLSAAKSGGVPKMLNFFVQLVNTIGVPVVLVGTYRAIEVLTGQFSQIRRGTGQGDLVWDRMEEDEIWDLFVGTLWEYQYTREPTPLTEELSHTLYDQSQGITDFAVKLYMLAQVRAITAKEKENGRERIMPKTIKSVAKDSLRLAVPVLDALRRRDLRALRKIDDVHPIDFDAFLRSAVKAQVVGKLRGLPRRPTPGDESGDTAGAGGPAEAPAPAAEAAAPRPAGKRRGRKKPWGMEDVRGEMALVVSRFSGASKTPAYEALRAAGYMRPSAEYLDAEAGAA